VIATTATAPALRLIEALPGNYSGWQWCIATEEDHPRILAALGPVIGWTDQQTADARLLLSGAALCRVCSESAASLADLAIVLRSLSLPQVAADLEAQIHHLRREVGLVSRAPAARR